MQEQIDKIELVLENCEAVTIDGKHIGNVDIDNIEYSINRLACNYIDETYTANHFSISVHRDANIEEDMSFIVGDLKDKRKPLDRVHSHHDITNIYVHFAKPKGLKGLFKKPEVKHFQVDWHYDDDDYSTQWSNKNQKTHMNQFGDIFIVIDENMGVNDVFDFALAEDKGYMDFVWDMYN